MDKGRVMGVTYPGSCKAFGTASRLILISKSERCGFEGWMIWWVRDWTVVVRGWRRSMAQCSGGGGVEWCPPGLRPGNGALQ